MNRTHRFHTTTAPLWWAATLLLVSATGCVCISAEGLLVSCEEDGGCREGGTCRADGLCHPSGEGDAGSLGNDDGGAACACESSECVSATCLDDGGCDLAPRVGACVVDGGSGPHVCAGSTCTCAHPGAESSCTDGVDDDCDGLADCADPDCDQVTCRAAAGACDAEERCGNGACAPDGLADAGTVCRPSASDCDRAEVCSGDSLRCPPDELAPALTLCRAQTGACDQAEFCDGDAGLCPPDVQACPADSYCNGAACVALRSQGELCTLDMQCLSGFCVDGFCCSSECTGACDACSAALSVGADGVCSPTKPTTVCRPATDAGCDRAERCTGLSASCPADTFLDAGVVCHPSAGPCDSAEMCSGASPQCPPDVLAPVTTVCRIDVDVCDAVERCTSGTAACPADAFEPTTTVCRAAVGSCNPRETCTGASVSCPGDSVTLPGVSCGNNKVCNGAGVCVSCASSQACTGNPTACRLGTTSCTTGAQTCVDSTVFSPVGSACATNKSCNSVGACVSAAGCSDGTREGFALPTYPSIAACSGGWGVPGLTTGVRCSRNSGNNSSNTSGSGCAAADLCAVGWHVCTSAAEVSLRAGGSCAGATSSLGLAFYATQQSGPGGIQCGAGTNDFFGCGNLGMGNLVTDPSCGPLNNFSNDCAALGGGLPFPWGYSVCNSFAEQLNVVKVGSSLGGVLCCPD